MLCTRNSSLLSHQGVCHRWRLHRVTHYLPLDLASPCFAPWVYVQVLSYTRLESYTGVIKWVLPCGSHFGHLTKHTDRTLYMKDVRILSKEYTLNCSRRACTLQGQASTNHRGWLPHILKDHIKLNIPPNSDATRSLSLNLDYMLTKEEKGMRCIHVVNDFIILYTGINGAKAKKQGKRLYCKWSLGLRPFVSAYSLR